MSRHSEFRLDAFLDGVTGAGLFGWLRRPEAPVAFIATTGEAPAVSQILVPPPEKLGTAPAPQDFFAGSIFSPITQAAASRPERPEQKHPGPADQAAAEPSKVNSRA